MTTTRSLNSYYHWFFVTLTPDMGEYVVKNKEQIPDKEIAHFAAYKKNRTEEVGDMIFSPLTGLPRFVGYLYKNPLARVVAVATALTVGMFFIAYPVMMKGLVIKGFSYVITSVNFRPEYIKITAVAFGSYMITCWAVRAYGRFQNTAFDKVFDRTPPKPLPAPPIKDS